MGKVDLAGELVDSEIVHLELLDTDKAKEIKRLFDVDADMIMLMKEKEK